MPFISDTASAIRSRFGFHDHSSSTPNLHKSASKESFSAVRSIGDWDDDDDDGKASASNQSFEFHEDPSFWKDHNVQVIIRVRPLSTAEISVQGYGKCVRQESCQTIAWTGHPESRFTFDIVADENVSQEQLFKVAGLPMVDNCMIGYNSCMFAYGQTGSGKTHTMLGDIEGGTGRHSVNCGMTPRVFGYLFSRIQKEKEAGRDEKLKFICKCSFLEIYNEQILDLLDPSSNNLQIREDIKKGVYVENLKEVEVTSARDVIQQLIQGAANRKVAATNMNHASSRSHSVFTCIIESKRECQGVAHHRFARLNLVDLAGSERQKSSGAEGERLKEATNINKSLSTLGLVIMNLVNMSNGKSLHVPYRDSKLTFLLQDSLGGNSKTTIIANISPSSCCSLETLSTLKFAQRAKFIKNNAIVNEDASGDVIAMRVQIQQLKLLEALDWKLMHESEPLTAQNTNQDVVMEGQMDDNLLISNQEQASPWQSSIKEENEFLRMQAIHNQSEIDTLQKKLDLCLEEKETLKRNINDLMTKLEEEKHQVELPSSSADVPVLNFSDQLELETMVDAIGAASQREAEAHETAIILSKENDELRMKLKVLIEDNNKLIELYEGATSETSYRNINNSECSHDGIEAHSNGGGFVELAKEKEAEMTKVAENLEHQLADLHEENEKLMGLYERAMQERDEFKRMLASPMSLDGKNFIGNNSLSGSDGGAVSMEESGLSGLNAQAGLGHISDEVKAEIESGGSKSVLVTAGICTVNTEGDSGNEVDVGTASDMELDTSVLTTVKLSEDLNLARMNLEKADEQLLDSAKAVVALFGSIEKLIFEVGKLSREIEVTENEVQVKQQLFESYKLLSAKVKENSNLIDKKLSALKYSLSNFSSSVVYFEQREARARSRVAASTAYLDQKKGELVCLQAQKDEIATEQMKMQQSEVELKKSLACLKSKLEDENRKQENEQVLFAIDNVEKIDPSQKNWHLGGKATDLLKSAEEKTKLQTEMKQCRENLGVGRRKLEDLNRKSDKVLSEMAAVQVEMQKAVKSVEEMELTLENVLKEKEMLLEVRDDGKTEIESLVVEYQQNLCESDLKEAESKILEEDLQTELRKLEELRKERVLAAEKTMQLLETRSHPCLLSEKMEEELENVRKYVVEAKSCLLGKADSTVS
ncbi:hypothetical protein C1H46_041985 [Malus baccata]|uniref:Kinesin motor domain-containing protein n=1 Tax=Malus baccata TaxID=106549 RepID=A0A540KE37_MALBA|nr:hypothetical protein C1H46_041985 [Malus baccata]